MRLQKNILATKKQENPKKLIKPTNSNTLFRRNRGGQKLISLLSIMYKNKRIRPGGLTRFPEFPKEMKGYILKDILCL